jgi:hypothetical protein
MASDQLEQELRHCSLALAAAWQDGLAAAIASGRRALLGLHSLHAEALAFWQTRLKYDLAASRELAECDSVGGLIELQLEHAKVMLQGQLDALDRLTRLGLARAPVARPPQPRPSVAATPRTGS